jgi:hypothetical protein
MKEKLQKLQKRTLDLLKGPDIDDPETLTQLATIPAKLQQRQRQLEEIESEILRIEGMLARLVGNGNGQSKAESPETLTQPFPVNARRVGQKKIRIQIDRNKLGLTGGMETIEEHAASKSLAKFLARLYQAQGISLLKRLTRFRVNRAPLVSTAPEKDFAYQSGTGREVYQYQAIADSGYFVVTTSPTHQKVTDVRNVCQFLGLPAGSVQVEEANKFNDLNELTE